MSLRDEYKKLSYLPWIAMAIGIVLASIGKFLGWIFNEVDIHYFFAVPALLLVLWAFFALLPEYDNKPNKFRIPFKFICPHCLKSILTAQLSFECPFCDKKYHNNDHVLFTSCSSCNAKIQFLQCPQCNSPINLFSNYNEKELEEKRYV